MSTAPVTAGATDSCSDVVCMAAEDGWQTEICRDDGVLGKLATEWRDLSAHCITATPFQSHAWLESWWRFYGSRGRLRVALVRRHGRLVAGAALLRHRRAGVAILSPIGHGISDFSDVLLHDEYADEAARQLATTLAGAARGGVVDLPEVRPDAAAWRLANAWPTAWWRLPASTCLELDVAPVEEVIARLPARTAKKLRRTLRHVERANLEVHHIGAREAGEAVDRLIALHRQQWQGRRITPEHARPRFAAHLGRVAPQLVADGHALLTEHRQDGRPLCLRLLMVGQRFVGGYIYGAHPDLRRMVDIAMLIGREDLSVAVGLQRPVLSLLRGVEPHKLRWRPREVLNERLILAGVRAVPVAAGYAAAACGRARLVAVLDERAPWVRGLLRRTRSGRTAARRGHDADGERP